jgi:phosphoribosylanthranilate isomerase
MSVEIKICGITDAAALAVAADSGADLIGLVFFPPSPRSLTPDRAAQITRNAPTRVKKVGLFVDADDAAIDAVLAKVPLDLLQLHGSEPPARVAALKRRTGRPVIKAVKLGAAADLAAAAPYVGVADRILFDAVPPKGATRPGGNALPFDWSILSGNAPRCAWMLSGGLTPENVAEAIRVAQAPCVDVSSGVEDRPGVKNPAKIRAFIAAARGAI